MLSARLKRYAKGVTDSRCAFSKRTAGYRQMIEPPHPLPFLANRMVTVRHPAGKVHHPGDSGPLSVDPGPARPMF